MREGGKGEGGQKGREGKEEGPWGEGLFSV